MREYLEYIKKQLKVRDSEENKNKKTIGSAIKFARQAKGLTLEEASENVSSCSYLSKIENNKIYPSPKFKKMFEEKLDVVLDYEVNSDFNEDINEIIKAFLFLKTISNKILEKYDNQENHEAFLILLSNYSLLNELNEVNRLYEILKHYIINFSDNELSLFLLSLAYIAKTRGYYQLVYDLIDLIPKNTYQEPYLGALADMLKMISIYNLNLILEAETHYKKYEHKLKSIYAYQLLSKARNDYILYYSKVMSLAELEVKIENSGYNNEELKELLKTVYYFRKTDFEKALEIITKNMFKNERWFLISVLILARYDDNMLKTILSLDLNLLIEKEETEVLIKYLKIKYFEPESILFNFIKNELSLRNNITDNYYVLTFILKDLKQIYQTRNLYKDASETAFRLFLLLSDKLQLSKFSIN